jgi:lysophospholipase
MLQTRFTAPDGWQWRYRVETRSGQFIRIGWVVPDDARALVTILPGLSEYCEKYFEVIRDLMDRKLAVACLDWRGQGMSWRQGRRDKRYHDDFAADVEDARTFLKYVPVPENLPRILLAHSMGGHIAVRMLHNTPDMFKCAVLTAPMMGLALPEWLARAVSSAMCAMGLGDYYLPAQGAWTEGRFAAGLKILTSDKDRTDVQKHWMTEFPDLRMGGLTAGWMRAALNSIRMVRHPAFLRGVTTPVLIFEAGYEMLVSNAAIRTAVRGLPLGELIKIEGSMHEVLMEKDAYRDQFWAGFDAFIAKHAGIG